MAKPGTPSGVNHSSESQTCGRKRSPDSSSSKCRRRTRSSSGVPSMRTGRSERRSPSSSSSVTPSQSNFLLNAVPIVSIRSGGLTQVLFIRLGGDQMRSAAEEEVVDGEAKPDEEEAEDGLGGGRPEGVEEEEARHEEEEDGHDGIAPGFVRPLGVGQAAAEDKDGGGNQSVEDVGAED